LSKKSETNPLLDIIATILFEKKGFNILALDVRNVSNMTDYFLIAEGTVNRHVKALSRSVAHAMEEQGSFVLRSEGRQEGDWIVIDFGDIVVHLFTPEMREKYAIEEVWQKADIVDLHFAFDTKTT